MSAPTREQRHCDAAARRAGPGQAASRSHGLIASALPQRIRHRSARNLGTVGMRFMSYLAGLEFIDCCVLGVLVRALKRAGQSGVT
jgi:hypothetical protein